MSLRPVSMFASSLVFIPVWGLASSLVLGAGCASNGGSTFPDAPAAGPDIRGQWVSPCVPMGNGQAFSLDFDIQAATWDLDYAVFGDESCQAGFVTVHINGPWTYEAPAAGVDGAWQARFEFADKTVTPHSEAAAGFLASEQGCGRDEFTASQATSIYDAGCAALGQYPRVDCDADYDLVAVVDGNLHFGARPGDNNMCSAERRPTALSEIALARPGN